MKKLLLILPIIGLLTACSENESKPNNTIWCIKDYTPKCYYDDNDKRVCQKELDSVVCYPNEEKCNLYITAYKELFNKKTICGLDD